MTFLVSSKLKTGLKDQLGFIVLPPTGENKTTGHAQHTPLLHPITTQNVKTPIIGGYCSWICSGSLLSSCSCGKRVATCGWSHRDRMLSQHEPVHFTLSPVVQQSLTGFDQLH